MRHDIHEPHELFEYVPASDSAPPPDRARIDVALLDMNHSWPNIGHDSLVHAVLEAAEGLRDELLLAKIKVRVISYDVRRRMLLPDNVGDRFQLFIGTGGPGHLDPRLNDGATEWSQGISEDPGWERTLFELFDQILADERAAMLAVCHSFGLVCRWSGVARPELRAEKSTGMPLNILSDDAIDHPWFSQFSQQLADRRHFRVVDNRLFDLRLDNAGRGLPIAFEMEESEALTMVELARDTTKTMPRFLGVNHHPEIVDREHIMTVLDEKRAHGEVSDSWYHERASMLRDLFQGESERQSRITSHYSLLGPLKFHLERIVRERQ
jgi:hypothetical protein